MSSGTNSPGTGGDRARFTIREFSIVLSAIGVLLLAITEIVLNDRLRHLWNVWLRGGDFYTTIYSIDNWHMKVVPSDHNINGAHMYMGAGPAEWSMGVFALVTAVIVLLSLVVDRSDVSWRWGDREMWPVVRSKTHLVAVVMTSLAVFAAVTSIAYVWVLEQLRGHVFNTWNHEPTDYTVRSISCTMIPNLHREHKLRMVMEKSCMISNFGQWLLVPMLVLTTTLAILCYRDWRVKYRKGGSIQL
jgi:hypothetical protein